MNKHLFLILLFVLAITATPAKAQSSGTYYESVEIYYKINPDRTLEVTENYTIYNSSTLTYSYTITRQIPTENTSNVNVWSDPEGLIENYDVEKTAGATTITIHFTLGGNDKLTYYVSYIAEDLISGTGPSYKGKLGGIILGPQNFPYQKYILRVQGPVGSKLFLTNPDAETLTEDPPTVRYETSIDAPGSFDGLEVRFYSRPVYYKFTLVERLANQGTAPINNVQLDVMCFNDEESWQFSGLISSSLPAKTMYVDEENNWHSVFDVGEISPGEVKEIQLELIYEADIYDPGISEQDVGEISEVPPSLALYLEPDDKWESDNPTLIQTANGLVGGETNAYLVAEKIVDFVVERLSYEIQAERHGALWAYLHQIGDCSEYTDLSIALARAAGLPARAVYGWGYSEDNLLGHAWAEFYLPNKGWQPIDPTWAETSGDYVCRLDPIHLARNVRGLNSGESGASITYYGGAPIFEEDESLTVLTASDAAQGFVYAAEYAIAVADELLAKNPDEDLNVKLQLARQELDQAQAAGNENQKIIHAKLSIESANEVIGALGSPPTGGTLMDFESLLPYIILVSVIVGIGLVGLVVYKVWRRR